ncbi:hypothetical protein WJX77_003018 [Trebouxia sp. C0004]
MYNVQPERVRQWDRAIQSQGSLTFADWKTVALDSSEVMQDAEESSNKINKLQKAREELQRQWRSRGRLCTCWRRSCRRPGQLALKLSKLLSSRPQGWSQVTKDLQEQLSRLPTEKAAIEQRLQAKTTEELTEWRNKMEGVAEKAQGRGQGLAARLAASGTRAHADSSRRQKQWALQPCHPRDEPKACPSVFTCLSHVSALTSQAVIDQASAKWWCWRSGCPRGA